MDAVICTLGRITLGLLLAGVVYVAGAAIVVGLTEIAQGGHHIEGP